MARKIQLLGHEAKLISPQFVRPFVKSNKSDFIDAEAICEAASRLSMRFVAPKSEAQQAMKALVKARESFVRDKVKTINQMHAALLEFGVSLPKGTAVIKRLSMVLADNDLPRYIVELLTRLHAHYLYLVEQIKEIETSLQQSLKQDEASQLLLSIPGVGSITASVLAAQLGDGKQYRTSRDFAASTGLVPRQYSTGGRSTLFGISKRGNRTLRMLLVQCARTFMMHLGSKEGHLADWFRKQLTQKHSNVVACALANKFARIAWAITTEKKAYHC